MSLIDKKIAGGLAVAAAALALAGCVSLFPKSEPAQLYRFGPSSTAGEGAYSGTVAMGIAPVDFVAAASGDKIMTVNGSEVAYIAASRWAVPANTMFAEALENSFERNARVVNIVGRREMRAANLMLDVDVNAFEVRYENGAGTAPVAVISLDAKIVRFPDRVVVSHRTFEARQPASDNRVGAIVQALDAADNQVLGELVTWADANAR